MLVNLRLALRRLVRRPGFTLSTLLIFGLGTGFSVAVIGIYRALFLRPLPYPDADQLVAIVTTFHDPTQQSDELLASDVDVLRWSEARAFVALGAHTPRDVGALVGDRVESLKGEAVTATLFTVLGARPALGRVFTREEDESGADVAVLSDGFWRRLGGDPHIVNSILRIDGRPHAVVGVLPPEFTTLFQRSDLYVPLGISSKRLQPGAPIRRSLAVAARLRPGVTAAAADAEVAGIARRLAEELPNSHQEWGSRVKSLREHYVGNQRPLLRLLVAGMLVVFLIGCANLTHLALANAAARRGEFALRRTLGAGTLDLWHQELLESLLLAGSGGTLGIGVAGVVASLILRLDANMARLVGTMTLDLTMVLVALCLACVGALLSGALPTIWAGRERVARQGGVRLSGSRADRLLRQGLLAAEVALSLALLLGGAQLVRGLVKALREDPGFNPEQLVAAQIVLPAARYAEAPARAAFADRLLEALRAAPGVTAAGTTMTRFRPTTSMQTSVTIEGQAEDRSTPNVVHFRRISTGYVEAMGARLLAGREFTAADFSGAPKVALVSESMAKRFWPGRDPIGQRIRRPAGSQDWIAVVGVLGDARDAGRGFDLGATVFIPYAQQNVAGVAWAPLTVLVRFEGSVVSAGELIRAAVKSLDPDLPVEPPALVDEELRGALAPQRFQAVLAGGFAITALLLVIAGLYGVASYGVAQEQREIGIRMALGALRSSVIGLVLRQTLTPLVAGLMIGAAGSLWVGALASQLLQNQGRFDPLLLLGVAALLVAVGTAAALMPARRASRIDPADALRE